MSEEIPLFPLATVLYPGGPLRLRIFEPRYLGMVSRCLQQPINFGVVAIKQGSEVGAAETFAVGTLARIVDWCREPDGLLGITVVGTDRFDVERITQAADGLYLGRIRRRDPEPAVALPQDYEPLAELVRKLLPLADVYRDSAIAYDDAAWVSYRLAELAPLPLPDKQALLETPAAIDRLATLRASLRAAERDPR